MLEKTIMADGPRRCCRIEMGSALLEVVRELFSRKACGIVMLIVPDNKIDLADLIALIPVTG